MAAIGSKDAHLVHVLYIEWSLSNLNIPGT